MLNLCGQHACHSMFAGSARLWTKQSLAGIPMSPTHSQQQVREGYYYGEHSYQALCVYKEVLFTFHTEDQTVQYVLQYTDTLSK